MQIDASDGPAGVGGLRPGNQGGAATDDPPACGSGLRSVLQGRYQLISLIGRGGMGVVYRAIDLALQREVAIKIVRESASAALQARFLREVQLVSRVHHPHTVYVLDFGSLPGAGCFLVMELLPGQTLAAALSRDGAMSPSRACRIGAMIASGMQGVHAQGVLHRDLKPANIFLLEQEGTSDFAKIVDFGIAKEVNLPNAEATLAGPLTPASYGEAMPAEAGHMLTRQGALVGTPRYMAPEQLRGEQLDRRADQYSLGCILYEMLTGAPPFPGDIHEAMRGHLYGELVSPRQRNPYAGISPRLEGVILRTLARRREDRFADMRQLAAALQKEAEALRGAGTQALDGAPRQKMWVTVGLTLALGAGVLGALELKGRRELASRAPGDAAERDEAAANSGPATPSSRPQALTTEPVEPTAAPAGPQSQQTASAALATVARPPSPSSARQSQVAADGTPGAASVPSPSPAMTQGRLSRPVTTVLSPAESRPAVSTLLAQARRALGRGSLFDAQQLLEAARRSCRGRSFPAGHQDAGCGAVELETALYLGRVHEAGGHFAEALAEYSRVIDSPAAAAGDAQPLAWRAEAEGARGRLLQRLARVIFTRIRAGRCEEVSLLLPPGEHRLELNGQQQTVLLQARETRRLGSCTAP